jgi:hypothetical protein
MDALQCIRCRTLVSRGNSDANHALLRKHCALVIAFLLIAFATAGAHAAVTVTGVQAQPVRFATDDLRKLPPQRVRITTEKGDEVEYEGVPVAAVLAKAGMELGKAALHGERLTQYLIVQARDGYRALLATPEVDPDVSDTPALLCYARNGAPLPENEGPFRLILPKEKSQARWVRQVSGVALGSAARP